MMDDIASLYDGYFNHFFKLHFADQKEWYNSCKNRIFDNMAQANAQMYNPEALEYKGISKEDRDHYIKVHSEWLHQKTDKYLQQVLWDDFQKMQVQFLKHLQEEVVPEMNHTMFFHVKDETLEQAVNENELPTFDKSSYSRYSDEKTIQDYFNEHNIWFYFHNSETTDKEFIRGVRFIPANRTTKDYPIEIYQPAPSKDSDIVYTCTKYHYLQMGAPDSMMFKGDNTDLMPDIPVDFTIPKADEYGVINVMISLKPDNIYGTWEVTTDMSSLNYGSLDSLVGAMDQAAGYMRGQTSGEAIDSMEKYVDKYQGLEDQARNSQSKSTWIIRPGKNKDSVEIECDSGGQTTYLDGTFNEKHDKLELKTSKASMNYTGSDGTTYDLEKYGLYTTGTVRISIGKNEKTGKASMKFEGEQQMKSQFANFKAGITGMKISNDY